MFLAMLGPVKSFGRKINSRYDEPNKSAATDAKCYYPFNEHYKDTRTNCQPDK